MVRTASWPSRRANSIGDGSESISPSTKAGDATVRSVRRFARTLSAIKSQKYAVVASPSGASQGTTAIDWMEPTPRSHGPYNPPQIVSPTRAAAATQSPRRLGPRAGRKAVSGVTGTRRAPSAK